MRDVDGFSKEPTTIKQKLPVEANAYAMDMLASRAITEEETVIRQSLARLNDWAVAATTGEPRVLVAVGMGFDEEPGEFYVRKIAQIKPAFASSTDARLRDSKLPDSVEDLGRELAASGFTVYPVATRVAGKLSRAAEFSGDDVGRSMNQSSVDFDVDFLLLDPLGSQRHLAAAGGGRVIGSGRDFDTLLDDSDGWYLVTYQISRPLDGSYHDLQIAAVRPDVEIGHAVVVHAGTSEGQSASRLRRLLAGDVVSGDLEIGVAIGAPHADDGGLATADVTVTIPVDEAVRLVGSGKPRVVRISVALDDDAGTPAIHHDEVGLTASQNGLYYTLPAQYSSDHARLAVTAEDLASGIWGGVVEELPQP